MKHHTIILLFALLYAAISTHAQTDEESIWRIKGFVDTYHAMRTDKPNNLMSNYILRFICEDVRTFNTGAAESKTA